VQERLSQYLEERTNSEQEGSVECHTETWQAAADLFYLAFLVTAVGGVAAFLIWQDRQTVAGQGRDEEEMEA